MSLAAVLRRRLAPLGAAIRTLFDGSHGPVGDFICPGDPSGWGIIIDTQRHARPEYADTATHSETRQTPDGGLA